MKKLALTVMLVALMLVMAAAVAYASPTEPYYHGDFGTDTTGCAKCHVTHAGAAAALLIYGPTQTDTCYYCHKDNISSPYNAKEGRITSEDGFIASVSGGFDKTFKFDSVALTAGNMADLDTNYGTTTSMHGVEKYDGSKWLMNVQIPGGKDASNLTGDFKCGSCHDPHAGGVYTKGGTVMPRLLKDQLPAWGSAVDHATYADWTFTSTFDSWGGPADTIAHYKTRVVTTYGANAGNWCAGCHDLFNRTEHDAGQHKVNDSSGVVDKYMHRMNFPINAGQVGNIVNKSVYRIALSEGDYLTCLTCHRAHGTSATVTNDPVFNRAASYVDSNSATPTTQTSSTVLLRERNRDVCFHCHDAAKFNKPSQQEP